MATDNNRAAPLATAVNPASTSTGVKFNVQIGEQDCQFKVGDQYEDLIVEPNIVHGVLVKPAFVEACVGTTSNTINFKIKIMVNGKPEVCGFINFYKHDLVKRNYVRKGPEVAAKVKEELSLLTVADVTPATTKVDRKDAIEALLGQK